MSVYVVLFLLFLFSISHLPGRQSPVFNKYSLSFFLFSLSLCVEKWPKLDDAFVRGSLNKFPDFFSYGHVY